MSASSCCVIAARTHTHIGLCIQALRDDVMAMGEVIGELDTSETPDTDARDHVDQSCMVDS